MKEHQQEKISEETENIKEMIQTKGWKIMANWLNNRIQNCSEELLTCDIKTLIAKRSEIKTLKSIKQKINEYIQG